MLWPVQKDEDTGTRWVRAWVVAAGAVVVAGAGLLVGTAAGGSTTVNTRTVAVTATHTIALPTRTVNRTVTLPRRTVVRTVTVQSAASPVAHSTTNPSAPVAPTGGAGSLTAAQVRAAGEGAIAIAKTCLDETQGISANSAEFNADSSAAASGLNALEDALRQNPDTPYNVIGASNGQRESMREQAAAIADSGPCTGDIFEQNLRAALAGLPN